MPARGLGQQPVGLDHGQAPGAHRLRQQRIEVAAGLQHQRIGPGPQGERQGQGQTAGPGAQGGGIGQKQWRGVVAIDEQGLLFRLGRLAAQAHARRGV